MHEELAAVAWKRGLRLIGLAALVFGLVAGAIVTLATTITTTKGPELTQVRGGRARDTHFHLHAHGATDPLGAALIVGFTLVALVALVRKGWGRGGRPTEYRYPPADREANLASAVALATGAPLVSIERIDSPGMNVGVVPEGDGFRVYFTTGMDTGMERAELEAICAAQLATQQDHHARTLMAASDRLRAGRIVTIALVFPIFAAVVFDPVLGLALTGIELALVLSCWPFASRLRFWARAAVDAAVVGTTHDPQALVTALPKVAAWNGDRVNAQPLWGFLGAVDRFWMVPVGYRWTVFRTRDGSIRSARSSELDEDVALLVRSSLVKRVCMGHDRADMASYRQVKDILRRAAVSAAAGFTVPVEGASVGLSGAVLPGHDDHTRLLQARAANPAANRRRIIPGAAAGPSAPGPTPFHPATHPTIGPGWFPDPAQPAAGWRWWDGREWTSYSSAPRR